MIATEYKSTATVVAEREKEEDSLMPEVLEENYGPLHAHIMSAFQENKDARESSGVNQILVESLQQYNGQYSSRDLAIIAAEGGSQIFMNLTSTKVRAAIAWIKDLLLASKIDSFNVVSTPDPDIPEDVVAAIKEKVIAEFETMAQEGGEVSATLREMQERKRDLYDAIREEKEKESAFAFKIYDRKIKDQMKEGGWNKALSDVIDDFCIFPTAVMKGPILTKTPKIGWENGLPVSTMRMTFLNKRISPFDCYPSPEADDASTGNFIEHMRLSRKEVSDLKAIGEPYDTEALERVLENELGKGSGDTDTHIEQDKAKAELKDDTFNANKNVYHALHFFGTVPVKLLKSWGLSENLEDLDDEDEVEVEAITIGNEVIKCILNDDPLHRRPYHIASFQKRPGSFWGSAPPQQMKDIQSVCNATSRALMNNMGASSGPMMEVNIERLAEGQDLEQLTARSIIQTTNDPTGGSGRAVQFFSAPSNASELLAVYKEFEQRADDVTMIPRYSYGNDATSGGAAQTASGLSMLLESASKGIKDAIRHIDEGIIIPRVELEFYYLMLNNVDLTFTGDSQVIAMGSQALTMRGAEQMRRNEFLQITANPIDSEIMGIHGRAQVLREMATELGFVDNPIPSRQILKAVQAKKEELAAQQAQQSDSMAITQMQTDAQREVSANAQAIKQAELDAKREKDVADIQLRMEEIEVRREAATTKATSQLQSKQMETEAKSDDTNKKIALELRNAEV